MNIARPDGRPEAYMLPASARLVGSVFTCVSCLPGIRYGWASVVMASPIDAADGQPHIVCYYHTPDDVVIYDPVSGLCHDKQGRVWREDDPANRSRDS